MRKILVLTALLVGISGLAFGQNRNSQQSGQQQPRSKWSRPEWRWGRRNARRYCLRNPRTHQRSGVVVLVEASFALQPGNPNSGGVRRAGLLTN
jgi:hypothetical protein